MTLDQLAELGLGDSGVRSRVAEGSLSRVFEGVYAVGVRRSDRDARFMAAVLACSPDAVLSHRSAAVLWGIVDDHGSDIDVTAPNRRGRGPAGVASHRNSSIAAEDIARCRGIPCTGVGRTLLDLASVLSVRELRRAVAEAEVLDLLDRPSLWLLLRRSRGRRGVARLRVLVEDVDPAIKRTRSELERRLLALVMRSGLPSPEVNPVLSMEGRSIEVDFLWREARLILEADGRRYHDTASSFLNDRRREQLLQRNGWRVTRCSWTQVEREPHSVLATVRSLLAQATSARRA